MSKHDGLFQNSVYNVIYKLLDALFPLVSAAYLGRVLMSDGVGKVAYAQNIAQYFNEDMNSINQDEQHPLESPITGSGRLQEGVRMRSRQRNFFRLSFLSI